MAYVTWTKRSFASGELSPSVHQSRTDLSVYSQGLSRCLNLIPLKTGSLIHRPNTFAYPNLAIPKSSRRIISFSLDEDKYALFVFGDRRMAVIIGEGSKDPVLTKTLATPYTEYEAQRCDFARSGSLVVITHRDYPPHQIEFTDEGVTFSKMEFSPPPWLGRRIVDGKLHQACLKIDLKETKKGRHHLLATHDLFKWGDVGRMIRLGCVPRSWKPNTRYPKNAFISMYGKAYQSKHGGMSGDNWEDNKKDISFKDGDIIWEAVASNQMISVGKEGKASVGISGSALDRYYVWGMIEKVRSPRAVVIKTDDDFWFTDGSETSDWNLSAWGNDEGYPSHVTFYLNRLVFSGTRGDPQSVYFSEHNNFTSFSPDGEYGSPDYTKALSLAVLDDTMQEIRWVYPFEKGLVVGTDSSLWLMRIDYERGFNVVSRRLSGSGVYLTSPLSVGSSLLFVQGAGRKIKVLSGDTEQGFKFTDASQLADHLFKFRIKQMVYQEEPHSLIWVIDRYDGKRERPVNLLGFCFSPDEEGGFAWHAHKISGDGVNIYSMASFPNADRGETSVWLLIGRFDPEGKYTVGLERLGDFRSKTHCYADGFVSTLSGGF